jgi:hypothetical protein
MTWDDTRIETAYRDLADRASSQDIADVVADAIRTPVERVGGTGARSGRAWLAIAAVFVLVAVGVGAVAIPRSSSGTGDHGLTHFHAQGLDFDYPGAWTIHDQLPASTGFGQTWAVIGTHAWPPSCGPSDVNCYYEAKLEPGTIAVDVGTSYFPSTDDDLCVRGATGTDLQGRGPDDPVATRTLIRVDGRPTLKTTYAVGGKDFYLSDEWLDWEIAPIGTVDEAYTIDAKVRGPGTDAMKADLDALIASIRLTAGSAAGQGPTDCGAPFPSPGATPTPSDPTALELATEPPPTPLPSGAVRVCMQALMPVRIVRIGDSVKTVSPDSGAEVAVAWPRTLSAHLVGGVAEIVASDGKVVAREGDVIDLGGGLDSAAVSPAFHICSVNGTIYLPEP